MSQSTNAILFYGYCWSEEGDSICGSNEEDSEEDIDDDVWVESILKKRGILSPWPDRHTREWVDLPENKEKLDVWYAHKKEVEQEFPVTVGWHCSLDYAIPYIAAKSSKTTAYSGYPQSIESLAVKPEWDLALERFCEEVGVVRPQDQDKPQWWLVSQWC